MDKSRMNKLLLFNFLTLIHFIFVLLFNGVNGENVNLSRIKRFCDACGCCANPSSFVPFQQNQENPCSNGQPLLNQNNVPMFCNWQMKDSCPSTHFCHVGMTVITTTCCQSAGIKDSCQQPLAIGEGNFILPRWYYNGNNGTCHSFSYRGLKGNANNFLTKLHCENTCPIKHTQNPCLLGDPAKDSSGFQVSCRYNVNGCPDQHYCHLGGGPDTIVCCPIGNIPTCKLELVNGEGSMQLPRWYYDTTSNACKEFTYSGTKGNANNFLTRQECIGTCQILREENPCPWGEPLLTDLRVNNCSTITACPETHWCHLGSNGANACCPIHGKLCDLPLSTGEGTASLKRWYYNTTSRDCYSFIYRGSKGNANNFLSDADCRVSCPVWKNPCPAGEPALLPDGTPLLCNGVSNYCPANYWCHIGSDFRNSLCCPKAQNPCIQPLYLGVGHSFLQRWYYNIQLDMCQQFIYSGFKGNQNNFLTEDQCQSACTKVKEGKEEPYTPCAETQFYSKTQKLYKCDSHSKCKSGFYCHFGSTSDTTVCCPQTGNACDAQLNAGEGESTLSRWYFDSMTKRCSTFSYKGSKGNANNFLTSEECRRVCAEINVCGDESQPYVTNGEPMQCAKQTCPVNYFCHYGNDDRSTVCCPKKGDTCSLPAAQGVGGGNNPRWYFSVESQECRQFHYRGIGGNENNFLSKWECSKQCVTNTMCPHGTPLARGTGYQTCNEIIPCPKEFVCHVNAEMGLAVCCPEPESFCKIPVDAGSCNKFVRRFAYDNKLKTCEEFQYGGCGGNLNNFNSLESCTEICCNEFRR